MNNEVKSPGLNGAATEIERKNGPYTFMYKKKKR
jgi:hypothetical protein